jgi:hypothetical protein
VVVEATHRAPRVIYAVIAASWVAWGLFTQVERRRCATLGRGAFK